MGYIVINGSIDIEGASYDIYRLYYLSTEYLQNTEYVSTVEQMMEPPADEM